MHNGTVYWSGFKIRPVLARTARSTGGLERPITIVARIHLDEYFGPWMQRKEGVLSKLCWGAISTYELESLASWALASSVGPDCVIIQERTDSWDGKVHRGDNRTNFAWNRNKNERGNRKRNQDHIRNQLQQRGCQWIFQPPKASHASGVDRGKAHPQYSYRLTAILGNGLVDEKAMATSLTEVESILNPRPVCAISVRPSVAGTTDAVQTLSER